jgi:hypothetical protein
MHNWYLGLLKTHCRDIWGMDFDAPDGDGLSHPSRKEPALPDLRRMRKATDLLIYGSLDELKKAANKAILWHLCKERGLRRASTVNSMLKELISWVGHWFGIISLALTDA